MKRMILSAGVVLATVLGAFAGDYGTDNKSKMLMETPAVEAMNECPFDWKNNFSLGLHGIGYGGDISGGGLGTALTWHWNDYVGAVVGLDYLVGDAINTTVSLRLQLPLMDDKLVPYGIVGLGGIWYDSSDIKDGFSWHTGAGVEYRFNCRWAAYGEGRYTFANNSDAGSFDDRGEFVSGRLGVKYYFGKGK